MVGGLPLISGQFRSVRMENSVTTRQRRIFSLMACAVTTIASVVLTAPIATAALASEIASAVTAVPSSRIAGVNRYDTAAKIAQQFGNAQAVVVANGENRKQGIDALAANYLAGRMAAPIVLTAATSVSESTLSAVTESLAGSASPTIYVMGATDSVSAAVVTNIEAAVTTVVSGTPAVVRIGGEDRYATSVLAASRPGAVVNSIDFGAGDGSLRTAVLVSGVVNADALAAGPLSAAWGLPVLLTSPTAMAPSVRQFIETQGIGQLIVLGGSERVGADVIDTAKSAGVVSVERIAGPDRFATAAELYAFARGSMVNADSGEHYGGVGAPAYLANGVTGFPDALAVGPLAAASESSLLTVPATSLPAQVVSFLGDAAPAHITALGQTASVAASVLTNAGLAAAGLPIQDDSGSQVGQVILTTGTYQVGEDIKAGRYTATAPAGESGNFFVRGGVQTVNEILGGDFGVPSVTMDLTAGQEIEISGISEVTFTPAVHKLSRRLSTGYWTVGVDIPAGRVMATAATGESGNFFVRDEDGISTVNEILGGTYGVPSVTITLVDGQTIDIRGISVVTFVRVTPWLRTTLTTGFWTVGMDIAAGRYVARPASGESGNFFVRDADEYSTVNEILGGTYGVPSVTVSLTNGQTVDIRGISEVTFSAA